MSWPFATRPAAALEAVAMRAWRIAVIVLLASVGRWLSRRAIALAFRRLARSGDDPQRAARLQTLAGLVSSAIGYAIFFIATLTVLDELGLDTKAELTTAGVVGLTLGLGSQRLVRDVIGGFFILLENQYSVGETVTLGGVGTTGRVEEIGLRVTKLRDETGRLIFAGNGDVTSVTNHSRGPLAVTVDLVLPADTHLETLSAAVTEAVGTLDKEQWSDPPRLLGLVEPPDGKIKARITGHAQTGKRDAAEMGFRAALRTALENNHIAV